MVNGCPKCKKRIPSRYRVAHKRFHQTEERKATFLKTSGEKFSHLWRIDKKSRQTRENLRLARARRKQNFPKRRITGGILPPKPIIFFGAEGDDNSRATHFDSGSYLKTHKGRKAFSKLAVSDGRSYRDGGRILLW